MQVAPPVNRMNAQIARTLEQTAALLDQRGSNRFRVQAYRNAANTVRSLPRGVLQILHEEGVGGLERLPTVGPTLARAIAQIVNTGHLPMLDRLRGESDPIQLFASLPGIGPTLAQRIHDHLDVETLEELEAAAHDGRLAQVPGFGPRRVAAIRDSLSARLGSPARARAPAGDEPPVEELLAIDREYRAASAAGRLPRIAPRRFNPSRKKWLSVMHVWRSGRHYTALYSNTARAHALGKTNDWVVLYVDDGKGEHRYTVVTATAGPMRGWRVVRGREAECLALRGGSGARGNGAIQTNGLAPRAETQGLTHERASPAARKRGADAPTDPPRHAGAGA